MYYVENSTKEQRTAEQILKIGISLKFTSAFVLIFVLITKDKRNRLYLFKTMSNVLVN